MRKACHFSEPFKKQRLGAPDDQWQEFNEWLCALHRTKARRLKTWIRDGWIYKTSMPERRATVRPDTESAREPNPGPRPSSSNVPPPHVWEFPLGWTPPAPGTPIPEMGYRSEGIRR